MQILMRNNLLQRSHVIGEVVEESMVLLAE